MEVEKDQFSFVV